MEGAIVPSPIHLFLIFLGLDVTYRNEFGAIYAKSILLYYQLNVCFTIGKKYQDK